MTPGGVTATDKGVEFKIEVRVCVAASGTVVKGEVSWVIDPVKKDTFYEYQVCAGPSLMEECL